MDNSVAIVVLRAYHVLELMIEVFRQFVRCLLQNSCLVAVLAAFAFVKIFRAATYFLSEQQPYYGFCVVGRFHGNLRDT